MSSGRFSELKRILAAARELGGDDLVVVNGRSSIDNFYTYAGLRQDPETRNYLRGSRSFHPELDRHLQRGASFANEAIGMSTHSAFDPGGGERVDWFTSDAVIDGAQYSPFDDRNGFMTLPLPLDLKARPVASALEYARCQGAPVLGIIGMPGCYLSDFSPVPRNGIRCITTPCPTSSNNLWFDRVGIYTSGTGSASPSLNKLSYWDGGRMIH